MVPLRAALFAALLLLAAPAGAHALTLETHRAGITPGAGTNAIAAAPDGTLWVSEAWGPGGAGGGVARLTRGGTATEWPLGLPDGVWPLSLAVTADGTIWFTRSDGFVGRRRADGGTARVAVPGAGASGGTLGPVVRAGDGAVWTTVRGARNARSHVVRIDRAGHVRAFAVPRSAVVAGSQALVAGARGRVWVLGARAVTAFARRGRVARLRLPAGTYPAAVAAGPGRTLLVLGARLLRLTTRGRATALPWPIGYVRSPTLAADGAGRVWVGRGSLSRFYEVAGGRFRDRGPGFRKGDGRYGVEPRGFARGAGGRLWAVGDDRVLLLHPEPVCRVPDLVGVTPERARARLRRDGCRPALASGTPLGDGPVLVRAQHLAAGAVRPRGTTVAATVAAGPPVCRMGLGVRWLATSAQAGLAVRTYGTRDGPATEWLSCGRETGRVGRLAGEVDEDDAYGESGGGFGPFVLAGRWIAYGTSWWSRYDGSGAAIVVVDAATGRSRRIVVRDEEADPPLLGGEVQRLAVDEDGEVAWIDGFTGAIAVTLHVGTADRELATGPLASFTGLAIDGPTVRWTQDGEEHTAPVAPRG